MRHPVRPDRALQPTHRLCVEEQRLAAAAGTERPRYLQATPSTEQPVASPEPPALSPKDTSIARSLRTRCGTVDCNLVPCAAALQAKRPLCAECYDEEVTREQNLLLRATATADFAVPIPRESPDDNTYAMAWTDGGRRDVLINNRKLKDVGGWAFLLLCGRGQRFVSSSSLGPNSTNNIAEFTAIKQVIIHAVSVQITQLDIKTDCMLAALRAQSLMTPICWWHCMTRRQPLRARRGFSLGCSM